jgi:hypothetical protein
VPTVPHWIKGWVNPRASLDMVLKRKNLFPYWELNLGYPAHSHSTKLSWFFISKNWYVNYDFKFSFGEHARWLNINNDK